MQRPTIALVLALAAIALHGCGRSDESAKVTSSTNGSGGQTVTVNDGHGTQVTVNAGPGASASTPSYAPVYPGATIETSVSAPDKGGMVTFQTTASRDTIIAFYKKSAASAGMKDIVNTASEHMTSYSATDEKTHWGLTVVAVDQDNGTHVQLNWGKG
jgi:ABC-type Fe3+-hydroxamate transport system substrate-binding protein